MSEASVGQDIREGLRWLRGQRAIRTLVMMAGVTNLFMFAIFAIFVLYAQDILSVDDVAYGLLISAVGVGGLVGALVAPRIVKLIGPGSTLRLSVGASSVLPADLRAIVQCMGGGGRGGLLWCPDNGVERRICLAPTVIDARTSSEFGSPVRPGS